MLLCKACDGFAALLIKQLLIGGPVGFVGVISWFIQNYAMGFQAMREK
jgi:hypothetical protein